jgi:hypothetical protein
MKIILISAPRCGTTNLYNYTCAVEKKYISYNEPFREDRIHTNDFYKYNTIINHKNVFVKQIYSHKPQEFLNKSFEEIYDLIYTDFDVIVFLDRINKQQQSESFIHAHSTNIWHRTYDFNIENIKSKLIENNNLDENAVYDSLTNYENIFSNISKNIVNTAGKFNKKIFYYEDIYFSKEKMIEFLNELNIEFNEMWYNYFLSEENKYRLDLTVNKLI